MAATKAITERQFNTRLIPIEAEIASISDDVKDTAEDVKEIKKIVKGDGNGNKGHGELIRDNRAELDRHEQSIKELNEFMKSLHPIVSFYKVMIYFGSALGLSVIALIWMIITHQVSINFSP